MPEGPESPPTAENWFGWKRMTLWELVLASWWESGGKLSFPNCVENVYQVKNVVGYLDI